MYDVTEVPMIPIPDKTLIEFINKQPDDRKLNMWESNNYAYKCGCLLVQFGSTFINEPFGCSYEHLNVRNNLDKVTGGYQGTKRSYFIGPKGRELVRRCCNLNDNQNVTYKQVKELIRDNSL